MEIKLPSGEICYIDDADWDLVKNYRWFRHKVKHTIYVRGYKIGSERKIVFMHNVIMGCIGIDHRDRNGLNNRRSNLRDCTQAENCCNTGKRRKYKNYKGVYKDKRRGNYYAQIYKDRICYSVSGLKTELEAAVAYDQLALKHHGEFARLNFEPQG